MNQTENFKKNTNLNLENSAQEQDVFLYSVYNEELFVYALGQTSSNSYEKH